MSNKHFQVLSDYANKMDIDLIAICAQVEYEISQLAPEEKARLFRKLWTKRIRS